MRNLRFADLTPLSAGCHVARSFYHPGHSCGRHQHDFVEAMWVEAGAVRHDTGRSVRLLTADAVVPVRPHPQHDIRGVDEQVGILLNVPFPAAFASAPDVTEQLRRASSELAFAGSSPTTLSDATAWGDVSAISAPCPRRARPHPASEESAGRVSKIRYRCSAADM